MSITIIESNTLYSVTFFTTTISTTVTNTPSIVDKWISDTEALNTRRRPIIGLDVEWRPNQSRDIQNPVAVLQLCVDHRCLIFQILHSPTIPESLKNFFKNPNHSFVGVGIENDIDKLTKGYNLVAANTKDVSDLAADLYGLPELKKAGIKTLAMTVLGKEFDKQKEVTLSRWDCRLLSLSQVRYACLDAFLSFEIGRVLIQEWFSGNDVAEGSTETERRLPCCGIGMGWFLFIIGFLIVGIPWYIGGFILICTRYDHREKSGYIACLVAAILGTVAVIFSNK